MDILTFSKDTNGQYFVADHNDEKLRIVAESLLNDDVRKNLKKLLENLPSLQEKYHILSHPRDQVKFAMLKESDDVILLSLEYQNGQLEEQTPILQIDMNSNTYLDLINSWEDLESDSPEQIILTRTGDFFTLTDNITDI